MSAPMIDVPPLFLAGMVLVAVMLTAILSIWWRDFGREGHALSWALSSGLFCLWWVGQALLALTGAGANSPSLPLDIVVAGALLLLVRGFWQRAGRRMPLSLLLALGSAAAIALWLAPVGTDVGRVLRPGSSAAAMAACLLALLHRPGRLTAAGWGASLTIVAVLLCELFLSFVAVAGQDREALYRDATALMLPSLYAAVGLVVMFTIAADVSDRMKRLARTDLLTGIFNRRGLERAANAALAKRKNGRAMSLAVADLDHFKQVNDRRGHAAGDTVLRAFTDHVTGYLAPDDLFGRIGGEEFAIMFVGLPPAQAQERAEAIRRDFATLPIGDDPDFRVTVSLGVAGLVPGEKLYEAAMGRADAALYRAKQRGRNRVVLAEPAPAA
jgi:diguanylate cyclase (GGDEF)-like protein